MSHSMAAETLADALALGLLVYVLRRAFTDRHEGDHPPGPTGWPIIDNVFDMPTSHGWRTFAQWGEKWGDIVFLNLFGTRTVILNSFDVANEMLDNKSAVYSDRPVFPVCGEIMGWNFVVAFQQYGPHWREMRRLFSQTVGTHKSLVKLAPNLEHLAYDFIRRVAANPASLTYEVHRFTAASSLKFIYGYTVNGEDDELVKIVETAVEEFAIATAPGAFLADIFPILTYVPAWFPGAQWKRTAQAWEKHTEMLCSVPYDFAKAQMSAGTAMPSFVTLNLDDSADLKREALIKDAAASLYAGAFLTVSAMRSFFLAMMCYPEVQKKAQAEIDRIIGSGRLPSVIDRDQLPYIRALCSEVLRWQPVAPLGMPHRLSQDDVHGSYVFRKGTVVLTNIWKMLHDPERYSRPEHFDPDRFIPKEGSEPETDPRQMAFGFGRRLSDTIIYLGSQLAEMSLFLICAVSLAAFEISKPVVDGRVVEPSMEYTNGTISHPFEFQCSIKLRSSKVEALLFVAYD
ncbi:cytochrome P450 [Daedalea quercina L-15889]|uniref:Cytochrome P450 n=1 Tax=Daedalea quercina L-15889 TaxID=1314783 RepID=A0A165QSB0_9APHY|nr:cytochrome P450 [Daedalea quercina L-15889]